MFLIISKIDSFLFFPPQKDKINFDMQIYVIKSHLIFVNSLLYRQINFDLILLWVYLL